MGLFKGIFKKKSGEATGFAKVLGKGYEIGGKAGGAIGSIFGVKAENNPLAKAAIKLGNKLQQKQDDKTIDMALQNNQGAVYGAADGIAGAAGVTPQFIRDGVRRGAEELTDLLTSPLEKWIRKYILWIAAGVWGFILFMVLIFKKD